MGLSYLDSMSFSDGFEFGIQLIFLSAYSILYEYYWNDLHTAHIPLLCKSAEFLTLTKVNYSHIYRNLFVSEKQLKNAFGFPFST